MNPLPSKHRLSSPLFTWAAWGLVLCGSLWLLLIVRDYHVAVYGFDATPSAEAAFWTEQTAYGVIGSAVALVCGAALLVAGASSRARRRSHHRRHSRSPSQPIGIDPAKRPTATPAAPNPDNDENVSFDLKDAPRENILPDDTPGALTPHGKVRIRVKRRIKVRIRKPKE